MKVKSSRGITAADFSLILLNMGELLYIHEHKQEHKHLSVMTAKHQRFHLSHFMFAFVKLLVWNVANLQRNEKIQTVRGKEFTLLAATQGQTTALSHHL